MYYSLIQHDRFAVYFPVFVCVTVSFTTGLFRGSSATRMKLARLCLSVFLCPLVRHDSLFSVSAVRVANMN